MSLRPNLEPENARSKSQSLSMDEVKQEFQAAIKKAFNPHGKRYNTVHAHFVRFQNSDINVEGAEKELEKVLRDDYGFEVGCHVIGKDANSDTKAWTNFNQAMGSLAEKYDADEKALLILIYSGHATVKEITWEGKFVRHELWIAGALNMDGSLKSPKLDWGSSTKIFDVSRCDVLYIMNCCCASAATTSFNAEVLAATSFEGTTSAYQGTSFTAAITSELTKRKGTMFTASELGASLTRNLARYGLIAQPLHLAHISKPSVRFEDQKTSSSARKFDQGDGTRILISAKLKEDRLSEAQMTQLKTWLFGAIPSSIDAMNVQVEGYFKGSVVILLTIPLEVWTSLNDHPAFRYIAHVKSRNISFPSIGQPLAIRGIENVQLGSSSK